MSRVMVLEDTDKDGVMDKATPFVDDMVNVRCIAFVEDGVLVVESGALWLCKDKDGDLRCDERKSYLILPPLLTAILSMRKMPCILPSITGCIIPNHPANLHGVKESSLRCQPRREGSGEWAVMPMVDYTSMPIVIGSKSTGLLTIANGRTKAPV